MADDGMDVDLEPAARDEVASGSLDGALTSERRLYANPRAAEPSVTDLGEDAGQVQARAARFGESDVPVDIKWEQAPAAPALESGAQLRPDALFVSSAALLESNITTAQIMSWVNTWTSACKGLEWISDTSLCVVYDSLQASLAALKALCVSTDVEAQATALAQAYERLSNIYDAPQPIDIELIARAQPVRPFKTAAGEPTAAPFARLALTTDVKERKAGAKSTFYQRNGMRAGKAVSELEERMSLKRDRRKSGNDDRQSALERLDAELDALRSREDDAEALVGDERPARRRRDRSPPAGKARVRDRDSSRERRRREALDAELDGFAKEPSPPAQEAARQRTPEEVTDLLVDSIKSRGGMASAGLWDDLTSEEQGDFVGYRQTRPKPQLSYGLGKKAQPQADLIRRIK